VGFAVLDSDEYILPVHRILEEYPMIFAKWQGKANGFTKGQIVVFIWNQQHLLPYDFAFGPVLGVADGIAWPINPRKTE
jgi:hypothetical protein